MISVVLPVLNEAKALPATLEALLAQPGDYEVLVVDGGSTDGTAAVAAGHGRVRVLQAGRGRGRQMNAGAAAARGETLLFLHADTRLPTGALARLDAALRSGPPWRGGAFRHSFASDDWRLKLVSLGNNLRCRASRVYFGDQAIFVDRALFEELGGFPEVPVLEDVIFCERLRQRCRTVLWPECVVTDARRFLHHGVWRSTARGLLILARHRLGLPAGGHGFSDEVR